MQLVHLSLMFPTQIYIVKSLVANLISGTTFVRSSFEMGTSHVISQFAVRSKVTIAISAVIRRVNQFRMVLPEKKTAKKYEILRQKCLKIV